MVNVVNIVHFKDRKVSSKLNVDVIGPKINTKGFVDPGFFFLKLQTEGESMKLSLQEAAELQARLGVEINELIGAETQLKVERSNPQVR